jgi:hypothetical protein
MATILSSLKNFWTRSPLAVIMLIAVFFRLTAAIFAKGYGMHDDHFGVIDLAQRWLDGADRPFGKGQDWISVIYPGFHYVLFALMQKIGVFDPQAKMYVVRFLHALYSLLTVYFGYKTVALVADEKKARFAGILLAVLWVFPFMSVRNLIEFVCIPPMVMGVYFLFKDPVRKNAGLLALSGALFGLAFALRFQTLAIAGTVFLVLIITREIRAALAYGAGLVVSAFVLLGLPDWIGYGVPFISFWNYFFYNSSAAYAYTTGPFYQYLGLIAGVLIPPTSLLLLFGFGRTWKKLALLFWPTLAFFALHSFFPNKQERFILPIMPFVVMLSVIGWQEFSERSRRFAPDTKLMRGMWAWFWVVNCVLLLLATFTYSKKSRVEALTYLSHKPDVHAALFETTDAGAPLMPLFYLGRNRIPLYYLTSSDSIGSLEAQIAAQGRKMPDRVVFLTKNNLEKRISRRSAMLPNLTYEATITPSIADQLLYFLNPKHNVNQTSLIYKVGK